MSVNDITERALEVKESLTTPKAILNVKKCSSSQIWTRKDLKEEILGLVLDVLNLSCVLAISVEI